MLSRMTSRELLEWQVYYGIEPFGEERADLRAGIIASTIANCQGRKKGKPAFKPVDFMPYAKQATPESKALSKSLRRAFKKVKSHGG